MKTTISQLLAVAMTLLVVGCANQQPQGPEADLSKTSMIGLGMPQDEVLSNMGMYPQKTEISSGVTEWHYCATGAGIDEFVAVYFADDKVVAMKNYQVTIHDSQGIYGHCSKWTWDNWISNTN